jgi:hypothetical protein
MMSYSRARVPVSAKLQDSVEAPAIVARAAIFAERELPERVSTPPDTVSCTVLDPDICDGQEYCRILAVFPETSAIAVAPHEAFQLMVLPLWVIVKLLDCGVLGTEEPSEHVPAGVSGPVKVPVHPLSGLPPLPPSADAPQAERIETHRIRTAFDFSTLASKQVADAYGCVYLAAHAGRRLPNSARQPCHAIIRCP